MASARARIALLALLAPISAGCAAERILSITSEPPGALVRLDEEIVGETPVEIEFYHYGVRRVTVTKIGYLGVSRVVEVDPPWYGRFPMDIVSEVLLPIGWRDEHTVHFELEPGDEHRDPVTLRSVLERAEILRRAGPEGPRILPPRETQDDPDPSP